MIPSFETEEEAFAWLRAYVDDPCVDNRRLAYEDDAEALARYDEARAQGCCGFADEIVRIGGRLARIGLNYGH